MTEEVIKEPFLTSHLNLSSVSEKAIRHLYSEKLQLRE